MWAVCGEQSNRNQLGTWGFLLKYSRPERVNGNFGSQLSRRALARKQAQIFLWWKQWVWNTQEGGESRTMCLQPSPTGCCYLWFFLPVLAESPRHHCQSPPIRANLCSYQEPRRVQLVTVQIRIQVMSVVYGIVPVFFELKTRPGDVSLDSLRSETMHPLYFISTSEKNWTTISQIVSLPTNTKRKLRNVILMYDHCPTMFPNAHAAWEKTS